MRYLKNTNIQFLPLFSSKAYEFEKSTRKLEIYQFSLSLINQSVSTVIIIITYSYKINNLKLKFLNKNLSKSLHFKVFPKENTFKNSIILNTKKNLLTLFPQFYKNIYKISVFLISKYVIIANVIDICFNLFFKIFS